VKKKNYFPNNVVTKCESQYVFSLMHRTFFDFKYLVVQLCNKQEYIKRFEKVRSICTYNFQTFQN